MKYHLPTELKTGILKKNKEYILEIKDLSINFNIKNKTGNAIEYLSFFLNKGERLGIVGESGCGKSLTALAIMGLLEIPPAEISNGEIIFFGENLLSKTNKEMEKIRGSEIGMIFQDPMTTLNPLLRIGSQIEEAIKEKLSSAEKKDRVLKLLDEVGIKDSEKHYFAYPHELSGGMRQRIVIAAGLAGEPKILIADEPTTALDVTVQNKVLTLMDNIVKTRKTSLILITHDLGVVADRTDRINVMYSGSIVETGNTEEVLKNPSHPYTIALLDTIPDIKFKKRLKPIPGMVPSIFNKGEGCRYYNRCEKRMDKCQSNDIPVVETNADHTVKCFACL